nr:hypothetical protein [Dolichospermum circinale]
MFGYELPVAKVDVEGRVVTIAPHPKKNHLLMQKSIGGSFSRPETWRIETYRAAAERFVSPVGCGIEKVEAITVLGGTWYAVYVCPTGVDLYKLIREQRKALKAGSPLTRMPEALPGTKAEKVAE